MPPMLRALVRAYSYEYVQKIMLCILRLSAWSRLRHMGTEALRMLCLLLCLRSFVWQHIGNVSVCIEMPCLQTLCLHEVGGQRRPSEAHDDLEDDLDDFIDDDLAGEAWRLELQQITGYDPKKCAHVSKPMEPGTAASGIIHLRLFVHFPYKSTFANSGSTL